MCTIPVNGTSSITARKERRMERKINNNKIKIYYTNYEGLLHVVHKSTVWPEREISTVWPKKEIMVR